VESLQEELLRHWTRIEFIQADFTDPKTHRLLLPPHSAPFSPTHRQNPIRKVLVLDTNHGNRTDLHFLKGVNMEGMVVRPYAKIKIITFSSAKSRWTEE
jgi:hypothetical protein